MSLPITWSIPIKRALETLCLLSILGSAVIARAETHIFKWVDKAGNLHMSDVLADVPEPYYSMYRAQIDKERKEQKTGSKSTATPPPKSKPPRLPTGAVERQRKERERWHSRVETWRQKLQSATQALEAAEAALAQARQNPVLRHTPQQRQKIEAAERQRQAALAKVTEARTMLMETLPKQAKKARVPAKWLE